MIRIERLDFYVTRILAGSYVVCFGFLVGLFLVFQIFGDISDLVSSAGRAPEPYAGKFLLYVVAYYGAQVPYLFLALAPFITVTAAMFAVSRLMETNEVIPMVFTGRSVHRVLLPVFVLGLGSIGAMVVVREYVLPRLSDWKRFLGDLVLEGEVDPGVRNKPIRIDNGITLFFTRYRPIARVMEGVKLFDRGSAAGDSVEIVASRADWRPSPEDDTVGEWVTTDGFRYASAPRGPGTATQGAEDRNIRERVGRLDLPREVNPDYVLLHVRDQKDVQELSYSELAELMRRKPDVNRYIVAFHRHLTFPLANLVLLLLALPFAVRFERGSKMERVTLAVGICGAFLVVDLICSDLGTSGFMHPLTASWITTVLFGSLAAVFYDTIRT